MQNMVGSFWNLEKHMVRKTHERFLTKSWLSFSKSWSQGGMVQHFYKCLYWGEMSINPLSSHNAAGQFHKGNLIFFKIKGQVFIKAIAKVESGHFKLFSTTVSPEKLRFTGWSFFLRNADSSLFKSWSPKLGGVTMGKSIFKYVYIGKRITKLLLKNRWARKVEFYIESFLHSVKGSLLQSQSPGTLKDHSRENNFYMC